MQRRFSKKRQRGMLNSVGLCESLQSASVQVPAINALQTAMRWGSCMNLQCLSRLQVPNIVIDVNNNKRRRYD